MIMRYLIVILLLQSCAPAVVAGPSESDMKAQMAVKADPHADHEHIDVVVNLPPDQAEKLIYGFEAQTWIAFIIAVTGLVSAIGFIVNNRRNRRTHRRRMETDPEYLKQHERRNSAK